MSDLYKVGIHLAVSGNAGSFFSSLGAHLLGVHRSFGHVKDDLAKTEAALGRINRMKLALGGGIAIVGGVEVLKAASHLETAGEKLVHAQTVLGAGLPAATRAASVLDATAAAWKEAGKNMNSTVTSNIEAIHDLYNVVQDMDHAKGLLPAFNVLQASLNAIKDGSSIGEAASARNVASAVRAFELMGKTDPHALEGMSKDFTRTTIALRGRVDGQNFLTAVQGAGDSRYGWGNEFATKGFPAMVNAMGTRAGNLVNMLNNNLYGGVASSEIQAGYQIQYGLHDKKDLEANGKAFKPGTVYQAGMLRDNPIAWANQYREHLRELGVNVDDLKTMQDIVAKVGRGNRSVKAALDELLLPMTNRQLNKEVKNIGGVSDDAAGFLADNDPKLLRDALHKQWENLTTAIGEPLVKPTLEFLKSLTQVVRDLSQAAAANPGAAKMIAEGIVALGAAFTTAGVAAVVAAIGPAGWIAAGIVALGAAVLKVDPGFFTKLIDNYMKVFDDLKKMDFGALIKDVGKLLNDGFLGLPALVGPAIAETFSKIGEAIKTALSNMLSGGILGGGKPSGEMPSGLPWQPGSYSGSGIDPSLIHRSSLVRGANDNLRGPMTTAVPGSVPMTADERNSLGLILKYESGGRNAPNYRFDRGHTAQGYYQITNTNWRRIAPKLGITAPDAMSATLEEQTRVAHYLLRKSGIQNWSDFNRPLRGALSRGERAPGGHAYPMPVAKQPSAGAQMVQVHTNVEMDGHRVARVVTQHQAQSAKFPTSIGGTDTYGVWHGPGTSGNKVA